MTTGAIARLLGVDTDPLFRELALKAVATAMQNYKSAKRREVITLLFMCTQMLINIWSPLPWWWKLLALLVIFIMWRVAESRLDHAQHLLKYVLTEYI